MKFKIAREQEIFHEATKVLLKNLGPAKMARLLAAWQKDDSDYTVIRDQLFEGETIDTLYEQIKDFQEA